MGNDRRLKPGRAQRGTGGNLGAGAPGKGSRAHRRYAHVPAPVVQLKPDESHPEDQPSGKPGADLYRSHSGAGTMRHQTPLLTDADVYGGADKRQADAKKGDRKDRAKYNRVTKVDSGVRFERLWQALKGNRPTSFAEFYSHGLSRGLIHKWERAKFGALYREKEGKSEDRRKQIEFRDRADRRNKFIAQGNRVKFNVTSQVFQQILIAPVIAAVDIAVLVDGCSKNPRECMGLLLAAKTKTAGAASKFAKSGARQQYTQTQEKIRRIDEAIAKSKQAADNARTEFKAALAEVGRTIRSKPMTLPHGGPLSDVNFYKAAFRLAAASVQKGRTTAASFIAQLNKKLAGKGQPKLTPKGETQATQLLDLAQKDGHAPRLPQDGKWSGMPGESTFVPKEASKLPHPKNSKVVDLRPGEGVPFKGGRPDFGKHAVDEFHVPGLDGGKKDAARMQLAVAKRYGLSGKKGKPTARAGDEYMKRLGLAPHHAGGTKVQLVPHSVHGSGGGRRGIPHSGGASDLRKQTGAQR